MDSIIPMNGQSGGGSKDFDITFNHNASDHCGMQTYFYADPPKSITVTHIETDTANVPKLENISGMGIPNLGEIMVTLPYTFTKGMGVSAVLIYFDRYGVESEFTMKITDELFGFNLSNEKWDNSTNLSFGGRIQFTCNY